MSAYKNRSCPICNSNESDILFKQSFAKIKGVSFLSGYNVLSCQRCGFIYASNIPNQEEFDNYYINQNKYENDFEQEDVITGKYSHIIQKILTYAPQKTASVVDIGCARSEILRSLKNSGYINLTGVDPSAKTIKYLEDKGIGGIQATINDLITEEKYDVVIFSMVLEHIKDLNTTIGKLKQITSDKGIIIVDVPDIAACASNELPFQEFSTEHINYFTKDSLSNLMTKNGFSFVDIKSKNGVLTAVFRNIESKNIIKFDTDGNIKTMKYIEKSRLYEFEIYNRLNKYKNAPILVWGTGTFTQRLLTQNILNNIVALIDSNIKFTGKNFNTIQIIDPCDLYKYNNDILISTSTRYIESITDRIKYVLSLPNEIIKLSPDYRFKYD